jgi:hypothetical protein
MLAWGLVYAALQGGRGSIGQRLVGLQLRDADAGTPIGFWRAVWRNLVLALTGAVVIGWFTPLFDRSVRRQGWHDLAARAVVVDARRADAATRPVRTIARHADPAGNPYLPSPRPTPVGRPASPHVATSRPAQPAPAPALSAAAGLVEIAPWRTAEPPVKATKAPARRVEAFPGLMTPFPSATGIAPSGVASGGTWPAPARSAAVVFASPPAATALADRPVGPRDTSGGSAQAAAAASVSRSAQHDDLDATHAAVPPPALRAPLYDEAPVIAVLHWDDGTRMAVYGRTLYGRNPADENGAVCIAVRDETLSLSKTHFEVGGTAAGPWITDRHSTNGTTLVRDGARIPLVPGVRTTLRVGDALEFGDRRVTVGAA